MSQPTDELVANAKEGDEPSYEALFERVADRLLLYVRLRLGKRLRGKLEAVDILQEAYLEAHRSFPTFESQGQGSFLRWMSTIIDNRVGHAAQYFAAKKRDTAREAGPQTDLWRRIRAENTGPATDCAEQEVAQKLTDSLEELDESTREVIFLRFFHGLTTRDISARVGIAETSVRRAISRGVVHLGSLLQELGHEGAV